MVAPWGRQPRLVKDIPGRMNSSYLHQGYATGSRRFKVRLCVEKAAPASTHMAAMSDCLLLVRYCRYRILCCNRKYRSSPYSVNQIKTGLFNAIFLAKPIKLIINEYLYNVS